VRNLTRQGQLCHQTLLVPVLQDGLVSLKQGNATRSSPLHWLLLSSLEQLVRQKVLTWPQ